MSTPNAQQHDRPKRKRASKPEPPVTISPADFEKLMALAAANGTDPQATIHRLLAEATPQVDTKPTLELSFWTHSAGRAALEDLRRRHWHHLPDTNLSLVALVVLDTALAFPEWVSAKLNETARYTKAEGVPLDEFNVSRIRAALAARNATTPEEAE